MRRITYGVNHYYKTASLLVEYAPFWVFFIGWLFNYICWIIFSISFLKISYKLRDETDIEMNDGKEWTTWKEWYGDLNQWFHVVVHCPVDDFCWEKIDSRVIKLDYEETKKIFSDKDKEMWNYEDEL